MNVLHIIRKRSDGFPVKIIRASADGAGGPNESNSVLVVQDAVFSRPGGARGVGPGVMVYRAKDDLLRRGEAPRPGDLTYSEIVSLIFKHDKVVCW